MVFCLFSDGLLLLSFEKLSLGFIFLMKLPYRLFYKQVLLGMEYFGNVCFYTNCAYFLWKDNKSMSL